MVVIITLPMFALALVGLLTLRDEPSANQGLSYGNPIIVSKELRREFSNTRDINSGVDRQTNVRNGLSEDFLPSE